MTAGVTAADLVKEQERRRKLIEMKEMEARTTVGAQAAFARKPYCMEYGGEYQEKLAVAAKHRRRCDECANFNATYVGDRGGCKGYCTDLYKSRFRTGSCTACKRFKAKGARHGRIRHKP
jgi:hypothetical protein